MSTSDSKANGDFSKHETADLIAEAIKASGLGGNLEYTLSMERLNEIVSRRPKGGCKLAYYKERLEAQLDVLNAKGGFAEVMRRVIASFRLISPLESISLLHASHEEDVFSPTVDAILQSMADVTINMTTFRRLEASHANGGCDCDNATSPIWWLNSSDSTFGDLSEFFS